MYCIAHCTVRAILYTKNVQDEKTKIVKNMKISTHILKKKKMGRQRCLVQSCYWHILTNDLFLKRRLGISEQIHSDSFNFNAHYSNMEKKGRGEEL